MSIHEKKFVSYQTMRNLLETDGFLGSQSQGRSIKSRDSFFGVRKGTNIYNLEKALKTYFKALELVKAVRGSRILFIGSPFSVEKEVKESLIESKHSYVEDAAWVLGALSNSQPSLQDPSLIVTFKRTVAFSGKECFKKSIPLISFVSDSHDISLVDYPILVNLDSAAVGKMYLNIVKQSIWKKDV